MRSQANLVRDTRGAQLAEYLLLVACVAIAGLVGFRLYGSSSSTRTEAAAGCIEAMSAGCGRGSSLDVAPRSRAKSAAPPAVVANPVDPGATTPAIAPPPPPQGGGFWANVGRFFAGMFGGDFAGDQGVAGTAGQTVGGFIPIVGQLADARDTAAAIGGIFRGEPGAWDNFWLTMGAWVPFVGDGARAAGRVVRQADEAQTGVADAVPNVARTADDVPPARITHDQAIRVSPSVHTWGTERPPLRAEPLSIYTHVDPVTGRAMQNAIYDESGWIIAHVDFKQHGPEPPGHFHTFPEPGNPQSGHGPGTVHYAPADVPIGWNVLPPGVQPYAPTPGP